MAKNLQAGMAGCGDGDGRFPRSTYTPRVSPPREYIVQLHTSDVQDAAPRGEVAITLYGAGDPPRRTLRHRLLHSLRNVVPFRRGQTDAFVLKTSRDIGSLSGVRIGLQHAGDSWSCHHVEVHDAARRQWTYFMCRAWLGASHAAPQRRVLRPGRNEGGETGQHVHCYKVAVSTANEAGAGLSSDAALDIKLLGSDRGSGSLRLAPRAVPIAQRAATDLFYFDLPFLGDLLRVELLPQRLGSEGAWHLRHIEVTKLDAGTAPTRYFTHDSVVPTPGVPMGHGLLVRPGQPVAEPPDAGSDWKYEVAVYTGLAPDAGIRADVVLCMWGDANPEGEPARRRLVQPVWQSHWGPVLYESDSCALQCAQSQQVPEPPMDNAASSVSPSAGVETCHAGSRARCRTSRAGAGPSLQPSPRRVALPVEVRRSVEPARRSRTKPLPKKEMPGCRNDELPRKKLIAGRRATQQAREPEDPIEALRFHGLLDDSGSLFEEVANGSSSTPSASSVLSCGLGRRAEQLLSMRLSYCHALSAYRPPAVHRRTSNKEQQFEPCNIMDDRVSMQASDEAAEGCEYSDDAFDDEMEGQSIDSCCHVAKDVPSRPSECENLPISPTAGSDGCRGPADEDGDDAADVASQCDGWSSAGRCAVFLVDAVGLGRLTRIRVDTQLGHADDVPEDGSVSHPGWLLDRIEVWDRASAQVYNFCAGATGKRVPCGGSLHLVAGRPVATYLITIHSHADVDVVAVEVQAWLSLDHQGNAQGNLKSALLSTRGAQSHVFLPGSVETFAVTLPDVGDAPDGLRLRCGTLRACGHDHLPGKSRALPNGGSMGGDGVEWAVARVEVCRAGSVSGRSSAFEYIPVSHQQNGGKPALTSGSEMEFTLPLDPPSGLSSSAVCHHAPTAGPTKYRVSVQTSNIRGAGTQASVWLTLYGTNDSGGETDSGVHELSSASLLAMIAELDSEDGRAYLRPEEVERVREELTSPQDRFERGKTDHFLLECAAPLGRLTRVLIWTDGAGLEPDWHVYQVEVAELSTGRRTSFPFNDWLTRASSAPPPEWAPRELTSTCRSPTSCSTWAMLQAGATLPSRPPPSPSSWKYRVEVYTSGLPDAGTDVEVYLTLRGSRGESGPHELGPALLLDASRYPDPDHPDLFEPGQIDVFVLDCADLGRLRSVLVGHYGLDCNAAWHLEQVVVVDQHPKGRRAVVEHEVSACPRYHFLCDRWLSKALEDGHTMVELPMSRPASIRHSLPSSSLGVRGSAFASSSKRSPPPKKGLYLSGMQTINPILGEDVVGPGGQPWRHSGPVIRRRETDVMKGYSALLDAQLSASAMVEGQAERVLVAERRARATDRVTLG